MALTVVQHVLQRAKAIGISEVSVFRGLHSHRLSLWFT